ncbi:class II fructose-bisphosphate aldolase [Enterovibrio nigricans]|uniref:Fructose-bisphosphate aldolase, class II n=1 Tax=Enterovibrio nigricans DSM 22720 TaxID=1121868 RepID=A0A1T4UUJ5_9GAMM|nr:class II fructose-bisphosphate aldolase [Enterovibrio nigricans]PKF49775.1 fructose-bisphosphate aldolase [Enterovibrio nigricans]SKA56334.1 fructose-bisphosphate aldolase, class II [Enterovibrio nigricans DSM 22720]
MLVTLNDILPLEAQSSSAVACCNVFGIEEAKAIISAAEHLNRPVILAVNKDMVDLAGVEAMAGLLLPLAESSDTQVCVHLDHCYEEAIVYRAIHAGFTSVMFDGSQLPLEENIRRTRQVVNVAHAVGVSVEGELGSVPYQEGRDHIKSEFTASAEATIYANESGIDALAVSVGNVHRMTEAGSPIDFALLEEIEAVTTLPLVIHGTTGITEADLLRLKTQRIAKFNVGTTLRMAFGNAIREAMEIEPDKFDKQYFAGKAIPALQQEAIRVLSLLSSPRPIRERR